VAVGCRFEFDRVNKILLMRFDGQLTEESVASFYLEIRKHSIATDARAGIWDLSASTDVTLTPQFLRRLAGMDPAMPDPTERPRFIVVPAVAGLAIPRMFEMAGKEKNPLLRVVSTVDDALAALGVRSPHFEPLA
jgi:hypothetical protein